MQLRDLEYFLAVAELGHFGRAAERCHCTQSTLSGQLKRFEEELGGPLFDRIPGGARLTPLGEQCLPPAREILAQQQRLLAFGEAARDPLSGTLTLGAIPTIGPYLWPLALPSLRQALPAISFLLREEQTKTLVVSLRDGLLDAGILALPCDAPGLEVEPLWIEPFLLAVPRTHPLADRSRVPVVELAGQELLLLEDGHCLRDQALAVCQLAGAWENSGFRATSLETLRLMVRSGSGITLLPESAAVPDPDLRFLPLVEAPARPVALFWRKGHPRAAVLQRVAAALRRAWAARG